MCKAEHIDIGYSKRIMSKSTLALLWLAVTQKGESPYITLLNPFFRVTGFCSRHLTPQPVILGTFLLRLRNLALYN